MRGPKLLRTGFSSSKGETQVSQSIESDSKNVINFSEWKEKLRDKQAADEAAARQAEDTRMRLLLQEFRL